jgi:hypothetical protein
MISTVEEEMGKLKLKNKMGCADGFVHDLFAAFVNNFEGTRNDYRYAALSVCAFISANVFPMPEEIYLDESPFFQDDHEILEVSCDFCLPPNDIKFEKKILSYRIDDPLTNNLEITPQTTQIKRRRNPGEEAEKPRTKRKKFFTVSKADNEDDFFD